MWLLRGPNEIPLADIYEAILGGLIKGSSMLHSNLN